MALDILRGHIGLTIDYLKKYINFSIITIYPAVIKGFDYGF